MLFLHRVARTVPILHSKSWNWVPSKQVSPNFLLPYCVSLALIQTSTVLLTASSYTVVRLNAQYLKKKKKSLSLYYGSWTSTRLHLTFIPTCMLKYLGKLPGFVSLASLLRAMLQVGCLFRFTTRHCLSQLPAPLSSCQTQFTCFYCWAITYQGVLLGCPYAITAA